MQVAEFVKPKSLDEAFELINTNNKNQIIGGGAWMKLTVKQADKLVSLDDLSLRGIEVFEDRIEIKALTTLREIEVHQDIQKLYSGILSEACHNIMGIGVRNIATIGGTVMARLAFSDIYPVLLAMDATLVFHKAKEIRFKEFLSNPRMTRDILLKVVLRKNEGTGFFRKVSTTALDFAIINFGMVKNSDGISIAIGSTPSVAKLAEEAMAYLNSQEQISDSEILHATDLVLREIPISSNMRGSKEYRIELVKAYVKRGLRKVI